MKFYTTLHKYYCGIDLHAQLLYVCIPDVRGNKVLHKKIKAVPRQLFKLFEPYIVFLNRPNIGFSKDSMYFVKRIFNLLV